MAFRGLDNAQFGVTMFPTDTAIGPVEIAQAVEERGLDSLFFPEHTTSPPVVQHRFQAAGNYPRCIGAPTIRSSHWAPPQPRRTVFDWVPESVSSSSATPSSWRRRSRPSTPYPTVARSSASAPAGTARRWRTTAPTTRTVGPSSARRFSPCGRSGTTRRPSSMARMSTSIQSGPTPSPSRTTARRSGSVPTPSGCSTVSPTTATAGCRSAAWDPETLERLKEAVEARGRRVEDIDLALFGAPADAGEVRGRIGQGFDHVIFVVPPAQEDVVLPLLDRYAAIVEEVKKG